MNKVITWKYVMRSFLLKFIIATVFGLGSGIPVFGVVNANESPFKNAIANWQMADLTESTGKSKGLAIEGNVKIGVKLVGVSREESLLRGGDGFVAELTGGWLRIGKGGDDGLELDIEDSITICARVKPAGSHLEGSLFTRWTKSPGMAVDLSAWYMRWGDLGRWNLGFAASKGDRRGLCDGGHLRLEKGDHSDWHDIVIRIDKNRVEDFSYMGKWPVTDIFVDGALRRRSYSAGQAGWINSQLFLYDEVGSRIGAEPDGRAPFRGLIDHVAIWSRALTDQEVDSLSAGLTQVNPAQIQPLADRKFGGALLPDDMPQEERCRILNQEMLGALKELLDHQPWFPRYHIALPGVVMNTHAISYNGLHHMFPITETSGKRYPPIDTHYYRHIVSEDLVQWKLMPLPFREFLFPNGTLVFRKNGLISLIAGPRMEMASSADKELDTWVFETERPRIIKDAPGDFRFRDTAIFKYNDKWYMAAQPLPGSKDPRLLLYESPNLMNWSYVGILFEDCPGECVQVLPYEDKLIIFGGDEGYIVGTFENQTFQSEAFGKVRYGSGRTLQYPAIDDSGRFVVLWDVFYGHMTSAGKEDTKRGFTSAYGLPMQIALREDNTIAFNPIEAIKSLRGKHVTLPAAVLADGEVRMIEGAGGAQLEIEITIDAGDADTAGVLLEQGKHKVEVRYNPKKHTAELDLCHAPYVPIFGNNLIVTAPLPRKFGRPVTLRVFYDRSLVEIFVDGMRLMDWTLFEKPGEVKVGVFARGGTAQLKKFHAWEMGTIWKEYE